MRIYGTQYKQKGSGKTYFVECKMKWDKWYYSADSGKTWTTDRKEAKKQARERAE